MSSMTVSGFCKQVACPSAEILLQYHLTRLGFDEKAWVISHLEACDFCCAELQLLASHPAQDESFAETLDVPLPLRRLAEAILGGGILSAEIVLGGRFEPEGLTLTDA